MRESRPGRNQHEPGRISDERTWRVPSNEGHQAEERLPRKPDRALRRGKAAEELRRGPPEEETRENHFREDEQPKGDGPHEEACAVSRGNPKTQENPAAGEPGDRQDEGQLGQPGGKLAKPRFQHEHAHRSERKAGHKHDREIRDTAQSASLHEESLPQLATGMGLRRVRC